MTRQYENPERWKLAIWSNDVKLEGRADSVRSQRRILLYAAVLTILRPKAYDYMQVTINTESFENDLGIHRRTVRRALKKLEDAGILEFRFRTGGGAGSGRKYRVCYFDK